MQRDMGLSQALDLKSGMQVIALVYTATPE